MDSCWEEYLNILTLKNLNFVTIVLVVWIIYVYKSVYYWELCSDISDCAV